MMESKQVKKYLSIAKGQLEGIIKMVEEDRYCLDVSDQLMATRALLKKTNKELKHLSTLNFKIITLQTEIDKKRQELNELQNQLNNNELYQLRQNLKTMQDKLTKMFEVLESDPQLMQEYKQAIQRLKSKEERER